MKTTKLERLQACNEAIEYVKTQKSAKDAWMNCERGDWMLWIAKRLDVDDRKLTLAKATCASQVRHLMKDQRSLDALDACFRYAKGEITRKELNAYTNAAFYAYTNDANAANAANAYAAFYAADAFYAYAAFYASASAVFAASAVAVAVSAAAASSSSDRMKSLKKSADICREILTDIVLQKYKNAKIK